MPTADQSVPSHLAILLALALGNDLASRRLIERSGAASIAALRQAEAAARNVDTVMAMGILGNLVERILHRSIQKAAKWTEWE